MPRSDLHHESTPRVCVLLATHNCERWLEEQLSSIYRQQGVCVSVVASDDASTDATPLVLRRFSDQYALDVLPSTAKRFGNANRNFLRLISDAEAGDAEYVALSDHDDVWFEHKLSNAVARIEELALDAYSSDVIAFWPDGRRKVIEKSRPQRRFDHLFESAGPGCTFVLRRDRFEELRGWVCSQWAALQSVKVHDWLIYAYARTQGWRWFIDPRPGLKYRQHASNELGANAGVTAAWRRLRQTRDGEYRQDILAIAEAVKDQSPLVRRLKRLRLGDRLWLAFRAGHCRRRRSEALALALMFLAMAKSEGR
jgi:rhamnosyltransferase